MSYRARQNPAPTIHVLFCADSGYFQHTAVAIASLVHLAYRSQVCVYVLTCDRNADAEQKLAKTTAAYGNVQLQILHADRNLLRDVFIDRHITKETYLRVLAPCILPESVHRVLYLDSDIVVQDDVTRLFNTSLDGKAAGAVADPLLWSPFENRFSDLGIETNEVYVNAGVMLMDLDRWRRDGISGRVLDYAIQQGGRLRYHDQDALNAVLVGNVQLLDVRWNVHSFAFTRAAKRILPAYFSAMADARKNPGIVHFSSGQKPWNFRSTCRKKQLYFRFLRMTAWRDEGLVLPERSRTFEHRLAVTAIRFGIDIYVPKRAIEVLRRLGGPAFTHVFFRRFGWFISRKPAKSCQRDQE